MMIKKNICGVPVHYDSWGRCSFVIGSRRYRGVRQGVLKLRMRWQISDQDGNEVGVGSVASVISQLQAKLPVVGQYQDETDWWETRS